MAVGDGTINGKEPVYFGIPKESLESWIALCQGQDANPYYPCKDNPYFYVDYDGLGFETEDGNASRKWLTEDDCEQLCAGCPLLKLCYDFAIASGQEHGVWGGIDFSVKANNQEGKLF